jgi:hypothetical protein
MNGWMYRVQVDTAAFHYLSPTRGNPMTEAKDYVTHLWPKSDPLCHIVHVEGKQFVRGDLSIWQDYDRPGR